MEQPGEGAVGGAPTTACPGPWIPAWAGPLDVSGLAREVTEELAAAVTALSAARGGHQHATTDPRSVQGAFAALDHLRIDGRGASPWAPLSGFFRVADGWLRLHGNYPHHATAITAALGARDRDAVADLLAPLGAEEAVRRILERGGVATRVRAAPSWAEHPQARATSQEPWCTTAPGSPSAVPDRAAHPGRPLAGVRVLSLARVVAGPAATQVLGCLGADVLRLDPPARPEDLPTFLAAGLGTRSAVLDLAAHRRLVAELVDGADVLVIGYRPGALDRFGLDPATLRERRPDLVVARLSAWGDRGPWARRAGFDSIVQAATGIATLCGTDDAPGALPVQALDHTTGLRLAAGVVDLLARRRGGEVTASLLGAARVLLSRPRPTEDGAGRAGAAADPGPRFLTRDTPHGRVRTVAPPLLLDGEVPEAPLGGYGAADPAWLPRP